VWNAIAKRPITDSFLATLRKRVGATYLTSMSMQLLQPERWEIYIVSDEEDKPEPFPLASIKVSK
jgi:hypothetical protein